MSAPKEIKVGCINGVPTGVFVAAEPDASGTVMACLHMVETYVHASEFEAVQARLEKLVEFVDTCRDYFSTIGEDVWDGRCESAIAAAKGE